MLGEIFDLIATTLWMIVGIAVIFGIYLAVSAGCSYVHRLYGRGKEKATGYTSLKTVTFGDESAVTANRVASVAAVVTIFVLWGIATGSKLIPFTILPPPFVGESSFTYTATNAVGETADGTVYITVVAQGDTETKTQDITNSATGFAKDDVLLISERRSKILKAQNNDDGGKEEGYRVTAIDGVSVSPNQVVPFADGEILMTAKGSLQVRPETGLTMEALYLPPPEKVWSRFVELAKEGYQGVGLWENLFWSLIRVVLGFSLGCLFGIPLGFAMGLSSWFRGWFDPIVEFMRPVPPLALIPLIIIWFGIGEQGKISLLFLAALWIMTIAARAGVSGVNISKVHAAYSLGATKTQLLTKVILPNSLPEIFTGARVAMGVCWGTVVAAELVAAEKGAGKMIIAASKFQLTDIVIVGIILIGVIGYGIDVLMRMAEDRLVPWKGKG
ncbi:ABC transporter permease [Lentilitoribacter sp. EG35]|uniref:ABC transporter permease n=1 Tax=Lentilitoribacter sp. EG35 TaxID=3234192 RepID=UPI00345FD618